MKLLNASEEMKWIDAAAEVAVHATCLRAKCGSVIVKDGAVIGSGYNAPPGGKVSQQRCLRKGELKEGFKSDRTCCVHAEQRAIMDALARNPEKLAGSTLYFARVDSEGNSEFSGKPYCTICSKMALDVGIAHFVLFHKEGITAYDTEEYNDLSFAYPQLFF